MIASVLRLLAAVLRLSLVMSSGLALVLVAPIGAAAVILGTPAVAGAVLVALLAVLVMWAVRLAPPSDRQRPRITARVS